MLLFLAPAMLIYGIFVLWPTLNGLYLSVTEYSGAGKAQYVGGENFTRLLTDGQALKAVKNTVVYALVAVIAQNLLGLAFARALNSYPRLRNVLRVLLFTPSMIAALVAAYIWAAIYSPLGGGLNALLASLGLENLQKVWLGDQSLALMSVAAVQVWMFAGQTAAIYLAGYMGIPDEIYDAAKLDGAQGWTLFRRVEWPLLAPAATVSITLCTIGSLKVFELPFVMTSGGPSEATLTLGMLIYRTAFTGNQFGYAAALALVMLLLIMVVTAFQVLVLRAREARL
ncbi:sugar ABC transporter permease [Deinococcus metallilatus]|nr:sugar ABC transporter permease [Deinococcus metallilatus]